MPVVKLIVDKAYSLKSFSAISIIAKISDCYLKFLHYRFLIYKTQEDHVVVF